MISNVLVSAVQQSESVIHIFVSALFNIILLHLLKVPVPQECRLSTGCSNPQLLIKDLVATASLGCQQRRPLAPHFLSQESPRQPWSGLAQVVGSPTGCHQPAHCLPALRGAVRTVWGPGSPGPASLPALRQDLSRRQQLRREPASQVSARRGRGCQRVRAVTGLRGEGDGVSEGEGEGSSGVDKI